MRGGTLFSGIGAPECALPALDWRWAAEIDPFASAVYRTRFPGVANLGDVTVVNWADVEPVDVVVFGSPCQSFSVAGRRGGLADPRGDLARVALDAVGRLRARWFVLENVAGLLSSHGGRDFGALLGQMGERGYGYAWRVLDARYFGVPQRRRRLFVVGHLGDWRPAAAVLFEPDGLCRPAAPRRPAGPAAAGAAAHAAGEPGGSRLIAFGGNNTRGPIPVATAVTAHGGPHGRLDFESETFVVDRDTDDVRRLTILERERLMGLPDGWTAIDWRGRPAPDGPRSRAIGNSMAVPVIRWVLERLVTVDGLLGAGWERREPEAPASLGQPAR